VLPPVFRKMVTLWVGNINNYAWWWDVGANPERHPEFHREERIAFWYTPLRPVDHAASALGFIILLVTKTVVVQVVLGRDFSFLTTNYKYAVGD